jgi:hypothetical protein
MPKHKNKLPTGFGVYWTPMVGSFNKIPVNRLQDGVISTLETQLTLDESNRFNNLVFRLLVSGSLIIVDGVDDEILPGSVIRVAKFGDTTTAYQLIESKRGQRFIKRWRRGATETEVDTFAAGGVDLSVENVEEFDAQLKSPTDPQTIKSDGVIIVDNGIGVLLPALATITRLNELMETLQETTGDEALTWFITGWVGDINKLIAKSKSGGRFAGLPDGASLQNAFDDGFSNRIFKEIEMLRPPYLESTSSFVTVPGESGISRFLGMLGYINKIKSTQMFAAHVMEEWGTPVTFDNSLWQRFADGE